MSVFFGFYNKSEMSESRISIVSSILDQLCKKNRSYLPSPTTYDLRASVCWRLIRTLVRMNRRRQTFSVKTKIDLDHVNLFIPVKAQRKDRGTFKPSLFDVKRNKVLPVFVVVLRCTLFFSSFLTAWKTFPGSCLFFRSIMAVFIVTIPVITFSGWNN